jgi:hypothetical protein
LKVSTKNYPDLKEILYEPKTLRIVSSISDLF